MVKTRSTPDINNYRDAYKSGPSGVLLEREQKREAESIHDYMWNNVVKAKQQQHVNNNERKIQVEMEGVLEKPDLSENGKKKSFDQLCKKNNWNKALTRSSTKILERFFTDEQTRKDQIDDKRNAVDPNCTFKPETDETFQQWFRTNNKVKENQNASFNQPAPKKFCVNKDGSGKWIWADGTAELKINRWNSPRKKYFVSQLNPQAYQEVYGNSPSRPMTAN